MEHEETEITEQRRLRLRGREPEVHASAGLGDMTGGGSAGPLIRGMETVRLLGRGSSAAVWLVQRTGPAMETDVRWTVGEEGVPERFALKVPRQVSAGTGAGTGEAEARRRLRAELEAMRPLHHEHLVRAWGTAETPCGPGLLLDLYQAGSLYGIVSASGRLTAGEMATVLVPVAEAVAHLHRLGAVHGDIQPSNLLLAPDGRPALSDLGESQLLGMPQGHAGAEGFLAPECWETESAGAEGAGPVCAGDVYALGATAWFALTGEAPAVGRARPPLGTLRSGVPPETTELLEDALSECPEDRPRAEEFARDLYRSAEPEVLDLSDHVDDDVLPELPTRVAPRRVSAGPRRWGRLIGVAAGLCLLGVIGWGAWSISAEREDADPASAPVTDPLVEAREALAAEEAADALPGIAQLRTAALEEKDQGVIDDYAQAGSPAAEADAELLHEMVEAGLTYEGPPLTIDPLEDHVSSEAQSGDSGERKVDVVVTAPDFETGSPVTQHVTLTLERHEGHWLLTEVALL